LDELQLAGEIHSIPTDDYSSGTASHGDPASSENPYAKFRPAVFTETNSLNNQQI